MVESRTASLRPFATHTGHYGAGWGLADAFLSDATQTPARVRDGSQEFFATIEHPGHFLGHIRVAEQRPGMLTKLQNADEALSARQLPPAKFFEQLLEEHGAAVFGTLRRLCGNTHDAEDVFQDTAARVWRHLQTQPVVRNPRAWLMTVAYRAFCNAHALRRPQGELAEPADTRQPPVGDQIELDEQQRRLDVAIAALPETLRSVVVLHYSSELSLSETALAMDLSEGTVKSRLNAALLKLRNSLQ